MTDRRTQMPIALPPSLTLIQRWSALRSGSPMSSPLYSTSFPSCSRERSINWLLAT
jgi:hypothetical protein